MKYHLKPLDSTSARLAIESTEPFLTWKKFTIVRLYFNAKGMAVPGIGAILGRDPGKPCAMILDVRKRDLVVVYSKIRKGCGDCSFRYYRVTNGWTLQSLEPDIVRLKSEGFEHLITVTDLFPDRQVDSCSETLRDFLAEPHPAWLKEILERQMAHWRTHKHEQFLRLAPSRATYREFAECVLNYPLTALASFKNRLTKKQIRSCIRRSLQGGVIYAFDELSPTQIAKAETQHPAELILHAAERLTDDQFRSVAEMSPYTAFECRHLMPPTRQATVLSVAYPYYNLLYRTVSETEFAEEIINSMTRYPEEWLRYHDRDFGKLFLALWHHLGLTIAPSRMREMLHGIDEEHRPLLQHYLASQI